LKRTKVHVERPSSPTSVQDWIASEPLKVGEEIIWEIPKEKIHDYAKNLPFGVGIILNNSDPSHLVCHIMGNKRNNANGQYSPMWYQKMDNSNYFNEKPTHPSHIIRTTANNFLSITTLSSTEKLKLVGESNISDVGSDQVIFRAETVRNARLNLTGAAREAMLKNEYVFENWGRKELESDKAMSKSIKRKR
jgi:hypothetical protein